MRHLFSIDCFLTTTMNQPKTQSGIMRCCKDSGLTETETLILFTYQHSLHIIIKIFFRKRYVCSQNISNVQFVFERSIIFSFIAIATFFTHIECVNPIRTTREYSNWFRNLIRIILFQNIFFVTFILSYKIIHDENKLQNILRAGVKRFD